MFDSGLIPVRTAGPHDASAIARIYNHYIAESVSTFEVDAVSADDMRGRIEELQSKSMPWLVAERDANFVGYAYAGFWHARPAYRFSTEVTVYLDQAATGHGIGSALYERLLEIVRDAGFHVAIGGISLPNAASVALHEKLGFKQVAHYEQTGFKFDRWIDVGYWQRFL